MLPSFKFGSATVCTYCGDTPDAYDHVFCVAGKTINRKGNCREGFGPLTRCCHKCNSALSSKVFNSFYERCAYISAYYNKKAKPVEWSEAQLMELDYKLREHIIKENNKRMWYRWRSDWFQGREFVLNLEPMVLIPELDRSSPKYNEELWAYFKSTISLIKAISPSWTRQDSWNL